MTRVIVTVRRSDRPARCDLEVPDELPAAELARLLVEALGWADEPFQGRSDWQNVELRVEPPGRVLAPGETLADAGVWDGAWLILQPGTAAAR